MTAVASPIEKPKNMLHLGGPRHTASRLRLRAPLAGVLRPRVCHAVDASAAASSRRRVAQVCSARAAQHGVAIAPSVRRPALGARAARVQRLGAAPDGTSAYGIPKADRLTIDVAGVEVRGRWVC